MSWCRGFFNQHNLFGDGLRDEGPQTWSPGFNSRRANWLPIGSGSRDPVAMRRGAVTEESIVSIPVMSYLPDDIEDRLCIPSTRTPPSNPRNRAPH
jgi:hypothetical protein